MGKAYNYRCDSCNHTEVVSLGIGFRYSSMLEETREEIIAGKYGEAATSWLKKYPDASIEFENAIYRCPNCGEIENGKHIIISVPGINKIHIRHYCQRSTTTMSLQKNLPKSFRCPECGGTLSIDLETEILWD